MNYTQAFDLECMSIGRAHTVKRAQNLFSAGYIYLITPYNGWRYWEKITSFYTLHCNRRFSIKCMKKCIFYTLLKTNKIEIMKSNQFINIHCLSMHVLVCIPSSFKRWMVGLPADLEWTFLTDKMHCYMKDHNIIFLCAQIQCWVVTSYM